MVKLDQVSLLKRFEPILKFSQGERFFPYNVDDYVQRASLWVKKPKAPAEELIPEDELNLDKLGSLRLTGANKVYYLQFISPMNLAEMAEFRFNELKETIKTRDFRPSRSRLARVGYLARILDAAFSVLLILRGRVPGDLMAAALLTFDKMMTEKRVFQYYGRVVRQSGWIILQYWYFYPFNDWRSGFYGANDHEADWEMVNIYCFEDDQGEIRPAWVGYACHNYSGDDLRRHWDDPELEKTGDHAIVYVGGGSHASYFQRGDYLTELSLPFMKPINQVKKRIDTILKGLFREGQALEEDEDDTSQVLSIPFVDYALGDGLAIGYGCEDTWAEPEVIEPAPAWVTHFRGLWGFYAQDPFSGEDAPCGPRYRRDGSERVAWFDPLGWAGLEKVVPPVQEGEMIETRQRAIMAQIECLENEIAALQEIHFQQGVDLLSISDETHMQNEVNDLKRLLEDERQLLVDKRRQVTVQQAKLEALDQYAKDYQERKISRLRSHIRHAHQPAAKKTLRFSQLAEVWAAISIGFMMVAVVLLVIFARPILFVGLTGLFIVMLTIESVFRRTIAKVVRWFAIVLALLGALILFYQFFWLILMAIVMMIGFYMIIANLRELFSRRK